MATKWYVMLRNSEFKLANFDPQSAVQYHREGWELGDRPFETRDEAVRYRDEWKARVEANEQGHG